MYIINVSAESSGGIKLKNTARDRRDAAGIVNPYGGAIGFLLNVGARARLMFFSRQFFCFRFSRSLTD